MNRQFLHKPWIRFSLLNFILFTVVFLTRIIRDAVLFSTEDGAWLFTIIITTNAVLMTVVGSWLEKFLQKEGRLPSVIRYSYILSAFFFLLWGWLGYNYDLSPFVTASFYLFSEVSIFLGINLIWIMTSEYFTDQQGQKDFPRISGFGLLGISFASFLILQKDLLPNLGIFNPSVDKVPYIYFIFLGIIFFIVWFVAEWVQKLPRLPALNNVSFIVEEEEEKESSSSFWKQTKDNYYWIKKIPFLRLFALVTVCNFILLAIFDNNLANGAISIGMKSEELLTLISQWVFVFGIFATFFQFFLFPKLLDKFGLPQMNMFAPKAMLVGVLACVIFASPFFLTDLTSSNGLLKPDQYFLHVLIFARVCGWVAEFLFNQAMLPLIYNSLPITQVNRGRFFIEGPLTAITNGAMGIFLLFYFWFFKNGSSLSGINLTVLYIVALFSAIFMLIWSNRMKPEFNIVMGQRISEGEIDENYLNAHKNSLFQSETNLLQLVRNSLGKSLDKDKKLIKLLVKLNQSETELIIKKLLLSDELEGIKSELLTAVIDMSAIDIFNEYMIKQQLLDLPANDEPLNLLVKAAKEFGEMEAIIALYKKWLDNKESAINKQTPNLLYYLSVSGMDGALFVKDYLEKFLNANSKNVSVQTKVNVLIKIQSSEYYSNLKMLLVNNSDLKINVTWKKFADFSFGSHSQVLSIFLLMLENLEDIHSSSFIGAKKLIKKNSWLEWLVILLIEEAKNSDLGLEYQSFNYLPFLLDYQGNKRNTSLSSINLLHKAIKKLDKSESITLQNFIYSEKKKILDTNFNKSLLDKILKKNNSNNWKLNNYWQESLSDKKMLMRYPELSLSIGNVLLSSVKQHSENEVNTEVSISIVQELYQDHLILLKKYKEISCPNAESWLYKRSRQYLILLIMLIASNKNYEVKLKHEPKRLAYNLLSQNDQVSDSALTRLQLEIPSDFYRYIRDTLQYYNNKQLSTTTSVNFQIREILNMDQLTCNNWMQNVHLYFNDQLLAQTKLVKGD